MVYKRVRGWTSGRSLPVLNFVKYPPPRLLPEVGRWGWGQGRIPYKKDFGKNQHPVLWAWLQIFSLLKVLANEDTLLQTQMFPRLLARATFVAATNFVSVTQNVSDFVQKHFVSETNVFQFARAKKRHEQQCFRNNVSLFATALRGINSKGTHYLRYIFSVQF